MERSLLRKSVAKILVDLFDLCSSLNVSVDEEIGEALALFEGSKPRRIEDIPDSDWEMIQP